jgi:hypothetical protein
MGFNSAFEGLSKAWLILRRFLQNPKHLDSITWKDHMAIFIQIDQVMCEVQAEILYVVQRLVAEPTCLKVTLARDNF